MVLKNRRFIAGAVCPRCAAMDRVFVYSEGQVSIRECLDCGYKDRMTAEGEIEELSTRVNTDGSGDLISEFKAAAEADDQKVQIDARKKNTNAEPVRMMMPPDEKTH